MSVMEIASSPPVEALAILGTARRVVGIDVALSRLEPDYFAPDPATALGLFNLHVTLDDGTETIAEFDPTTVTNEAELGFITNLVWDDPELVELALLMVDQARPDDEALTFRGDYFGQGGAFIPAWLAEDVEVGTRVRMGHDRKLWRRVGGVYQSDGEEYVRHRARQLLGERAKSHHVNEVVRHFTDRESIDPMPERPPYELVFTRNGAINWRTRETFPAGANMASAVQIAATYRPGADCPRIDTFIREVLPTCDPEFVYEVVGYCLLADNPLHKAFMFIGPGRNGKSTLLNVIRALLGARNCSAVSLHELEENRFVTAQMFGKLANICGDIDARQLRTSSKFKLLTGGDAVFAEHKGKDGFAYTPFAKLLFSANEPPVARDLSHAYFSRLVLIPFERVFAENEANRNLTRDLTTDAELSGLLNRSLAGLARLMTRGCFVLPEPVEAAGKKYREAADSIGTFVREELTVDPLLTVKKNFVYGQYQDWCRRGGNPPRERPPFYETLRGLPGVTETTREFKGVGYARPV